MKKILVIDDDPSVHTLIPTIFQHHNYHIKGTLHVGNLEELILAYEPDLILLNAVFNGIDGCMVCNYLKSKPIFECIPIGLMFAQDAEANPSSCAPDALINKPFDAEALVKQIENLILA